MAKNFDKVKTHTWAFSRSPALQAHALKLIPKPNNNQKTQWNTDAQ